MIRDPEQPRRWNQLSGEASRMLPLTPGGLGPVEAALIPLLAAASMTQSGAVLATLAYRMASLWLPLLFALPAVWWLRRNPERPEVAETAPDRQRAPQAA